MVVDGVGRYQSRDDPAWREARDGARTAKSRPSPFVSYHCPSISRVYKVKRKKVWTGAGRIFGEYSRELRRSQVRGRRALGPHLDSPPPTNFLSIMRSLPLIPPQSRSAPQHGAKATICCGGGHQGRERCRCSHGCMFIAVPLIIA